MSAPVTRQPTLSPPVADDRPVGVSRPPSNLPDTDGESLEPNWHRDADVYQRTFHTAEYFLYDPETERLEGRCPGAEQRYQPIAAGPGGRLWSERFGAWLGMWRGRYQGGIESVWPRLFDDAGAAVSLFAESAGAATAEQRERADRAEAEVTRLRALLAEMDLAPLGAGTAG